VVIFSNYSQKNEHYITHVSQHECSNNVGYIFIRYTYLYHVHVRICTMIRYIKKKSKNTYIYVKCRFFFRSDLMPFFFFFQTDDPKLPTYTPPPIKNYLLLKYYCTLYWATIIKQV